MSLQEGMVIGIMAGATVACLVFLMVGLRRKRP